MKQKGQHGSQAYFVSPLPIEECTRRLELLNSEALPLHIEMVTTDTVEFSVQLIERGRVRADGHGSLRRWEGTLTRVDCQVQVREGLLRWMLVMAVLMLIAMVLIPVAVLAVTGLGAILWFGIAGFGVGMVLTLILLADHFTPADDTPANVIAILEDTLSA